jgi:hypothetical protein
MDVPMSEPHKIVETKDYSNIDPTDLTRADIAVILLEIMLEHRASLRGYELYALAYASTIVHPPVDERRAKHVLDARLEIQDYVKDKGKL